MWIKSKGYYLYILNNVKIIKIKRKDVWVGIVLSGARLSKIEILTSDDLEVLKVQCLLKAKEVGWKIENIYLK